MNIIPWTAWQYCTWPGKQRNLEKIGSKITLSLVLMRLGLEKHRKSSVPHFKNNAEKMGKAHRKKTHEWLKNHSDRGLYLQRRKLKGNLIKVCKWDIKGNRSVLNLRRQRRRMNDKKLKVVKCKIGDFSFLKWQGWFMLETKYQGSQFLQLVYKNA